MNLLKLGLLVAGTLSLSLAGANVSSQASTISPIPSYDPHASLVETEHGFVPAVADAAGPDATVGKLSLSGPAPAASRATFSVGSDANCDFTSVAAALASPLVSDGDVLNLRSDLVTLGTTDIRDRPGSLTLRGGFATCLSPTPTGARTVFNGDGSRVFYLQTGISYSGATMRINLENLVITNGTATATFGGGGLMINGRVGSLAVDLRNVHVTNNTSNFNGGGISVRVNGPSTAGAAPLLTMDNASQLLGNAATQDGGGLNCFTPAGTLDGTTPTVVRLGTVALVNNQARNGGGIGINGCNMVTLYPGVFLLGIVNNTANGVGDHGNGGGIYVTGEESRVRVLGYVLIDGVGDPNNGGLVGNNTARRGGGIYLGGGRLDTGDIHLANNTATVEGGGVFVNGEGSLAEIDRRVASLCRSGSGLFALERCSVVSGNNGGNAGGAFSAQNGGEIRVQGTRIFGNSSNVAAIAATSGAGGSSLIRIENSIGWGNESVNGLSSNNGIIELRWSTLADNLVTDAFFRVGAGTGSVARIRVYGSIVRETGLTSELVGAGTNSIVFDCVIGWQPIAQVAGSKFAYMNIDPQFVNPANRDYRTGPTSPAIDYCDAVQGPPTSDFNRVSRGTAHIGDPFVSGNPNLGPYDIGAFETRWRPDMLFRSRFQTGGF